MILLILGIFLTLILGIASGLLMAVFGLYWIAKGGKE